MKSYAPSKVIVDLNAYASNLHAIQGIIGEKSRIIAVVKADAYGHGLIPIARKAVEAGVSMLAVAHVDEGICLREAGIKTPVLVMLQCSPDALAAIVEYNLTLTVSDIATAELLGSLAQRADSVASIHCKVDTGMGRQGFLLESAVEDIQYLTRISHLDIEGISSHFSNAEIPDDSYTQGQIRAFRQLLKVLDKVGIPYETSHIANSAGIINHTGSLLDLVRPGLLTYGIWPTDRIPEYTPIKPVLRWLSRVTQIRQLSAGASIGYGRTFTTSAPMRVAVIPVGYGDGYLHSLSNCAEVLIHGRRCAVRGKVSMDQIVVDVTQISGIKSGDVVTLIGPDAQEQIRVENLAKWANTIPYEIVTRIGNRVKREYIGL